MNEKSFNKYNELIQNAIKELIKDFCMNPFIFVYEADLQSHLYVKLFKKLKVIDNPVKIYNGIEGRTKLLHTEVHIDRQYFDIAIWDNESDEFHTSEYKSKPVSIAVEIKYDFKTSFRKGNRRGIDDIKKIITYFHGKNNCKGYALWFIAGLKQFEKLQQISADLNKECFIGARRLVNSYLVSAGVEDETGKFETHLWLNGNHYNGRPI